MKLPLLTVHKVGGGGDKQGQLLSLLPNIEHLHFLLFSYVIQEIWGKNIKVNISDSEKHEPQGGTSGAIKEPRSKQY